MTGFIHGFAARSTARPVQSASSWLLAGALAAGAVALLSPATAPAQTAVAPDGSGPWRSYNIAAGKLADVLAQFAAESGVRLSFDPGLLEGVQSPGLIGDFSPQAGFARLLQGSGYGLDHRGDGAYTLKSVPVSSTAAPVLATVKVVDTVETGSADDAYRVSDSALAGFTSRPLLDTPRSLRVVSAELLANQLAKDIETLGRLDASVTASYRQPGFHARTEIRGFDVADGQNYRYNGLTFLRQQLTPLENKERVEILKGLAAFEAGFAAPSGIVNYVTKRPGEAPITDLHLGFDQYGSALSHIDLSRRFADGAVGIRVNAAVEELHSYVEPANGNRQFASLAADWRLATGTLLSLDAEHQQRDQVLQVSFRPDVNGRIPRNFDPRTFIGQSWANYDTDHSTVASRLQHALGTDWNLVLEANWNRTEHPFNEASMTRIQDNGDATVSAFISDNTDRESRALRPMIQGRLQTGGIAHELVAGYAAQKTEANFGDSFSGEIGMSNLYNPVAIPDPQPVLTPSQAGFTIDDTGWFLQDVVAPSEVWQVHLGGRYATLEQRSVNAAGAESARYDKSRFTPNAALVFKPAPSISTYLSYIEGLENGGTAPQTANGLPVTNAGEVQPPLVSEQWEAGLKAMVTSAIQGELSLFQIERPSNFIDASNTFVQEGNQVHRGVELSLTAQLTPSWTVLSSALWLDAELDRTGNPATEGNRPTSVPEHRATLTTEYAPLALPGWTFTGNWAYTGDRPLDNAHLFERADAFDVVALGFRYDTAVAASALLRGVTFRGGVDNVFDERYFSTSNFGQLIAGAPRTVSIGVDMRF